MNILIVDGNEKEASSRYTDLGMDTQYEVYKKVLDIFPDAELIDIKKNIENNND